MQKPSLNLPIVAPYFSLKFHSDSSIGGSGFSIRYHSGYFLNYYKIIFILKIKKIK